MKPISMFSPVSNSSQYTPNVATPKEVTFGPVTTVATTPPSPAQVDPFYTQGYVCTHHMSIILQTVHKV